MGCCTVPFSKFFIYRDRDLILRLLGLELYEKEVAKQGKSNKVPQYVDA